MNTTTNDTAGYRLLTIGYGGWSLSGDRRGHRLSHYGTTWTDHLEEMAPDVIGVDLTALENFDPRLIRLSIRGPMDEAALPPGRVHGLRHAYSSDGEPWDDPGAPAPGEPVEFGNAGSFDSVSGDVYATLAARSGARIFNPREETTA